MTSSKRVTQKPVKSQVYLYLAFVFVTSFFTYFYRYNYPPYPFWDEPYHVAAAQKYLNGVFFMEPHPPLGKLLIALGEKITQSNSPEKDAVFIHTDYATGLGDGYSFTGYRLFPALLAWLAAPLFFLIFLHFTTNPALSALLSFLYVFDNAQIVHSRGAMVDTPVTFFGLLLILVLLKLPKIPPSKNLRFILASLLSGLVFGLIMTTKVVGLIFILLFPVTVWLLWTQWKRVSQFMIFATLGLIIAYVSIWQIHFSLSTKVLPELNENGYYQASDAYKDILSRKATNDFRSFPIMLRDSFRYVSHYEQGVPRLDLCKPDENGSPSWMWPIGARSINYRWERAESGAIRYLYLQSNPVTWGCGLLGVILSIILLGSRLFVPSSPKLKHGFMMAVFLAVYTSYMIAISHLDRVMYLYHYFIPLTLSYILFGLCVENIVNIGPMTVDAGKRMLGMTVLSLFMFAGFQYFHALSYYEPLTADAFNRLRLLPSWELACVGCEKFSPIAVSCNRQ